jgi:hypothetical protein
MRLDVDSLKLHHESERVVHRCKMGEQSRLRDICYPRCLSYPLYQSLHLLCIEFQQAAKERGLGNDRLTKKGHIALHK